MHLYFHLLSHTIQCIILMQNNIYDSDDGWVGVSHSVDVYH